MLRLPSLLSEKPNNRPGKLMQDRPSQYAMSKISVRFLIDKERKRVVFAEAGSDFIDILFSFLTLPLGSIVRLLGNQSVLLGSLDKLYKSVEKLDGKHLQTEACKEMLLNPRSVAAELCENLKLKNIHDANSRDIYFCNESGCLIQSPCYFTYVTKARCVRCGKLMDKVWDWSNGTTKKGGVFVEDGTNFIITDDLRVIPASLMSGFSLLKELQIKDTGILEEIVMNFSTEKVLNLMMRSLASKRVLTEVYFYYASLIEPSVKCFLAIKEEIDTSETEQKINVKVILNKKNNNIFYAEVGEDFVDQLLSFLTLPLGSMFRQLGHHISLEGCICNLYSSAESLGLECFKSEKCKNILVFPELASFYGCRNQMLKLDEMTSKKETVPKSCLKCFLDNDCKPCVTSPCKHGLSEVKIIEQNPKLENGGSDPGGTFVKKSRRFMVTDNLHISPVSSIFAITKGMDFHIFDLVEKEVSVDKAKVLSLLSAMLVSKTVLTDVFSPELM